IWLQIVIGLYARPGKSSECQRRFGILCLLKLLEWRVVGKTLFKDKFSLPLVPHAVNFNAIKIVEKYQASNPFVELVPGLQQGCEAIKVFIVESIAVVRNDDLQRVRLVVSLHVN